MAKNVTALKAGKQSKSNLHAFRVVLQVLDPPDRLSLEVQSEQRPDAGCLERDALRPQRQLLQRWELVP